MKNTISWIASTQIHEAYCLSTSLCFSDFFTTAYPPLRSIRDKENRVRRNVNRYRDDRVTLSSLLYREFGRV